MILLNISWDILLLSDIEGWVGLLARLGGGRRGQMNGYSPVRPRSSNRISTPQWIPSPVLLSFHD